MIDQLTIQGIKNRGSWSGELARVTLFCGQHRSGKSAAMEGARLAITGTSSVGSSVAKQKLIVDGHASARATGPMVEGEWACGAKRTHTLKYDGMEVKSVTGDCPVTVDEYWSLTGEQRWSLLESCVGLFTEQAPPPVDDLRAKLKRLQAVEPPPKYEGESVEVLKEKVNELNLFIAKQKRLRSEADIEQESHDKHEAELAQANDDLSNAMDQLAEANQAYEDGLAAGEKCDELVGEWATAPETSLAGYPGDLAEVVSRVIGESGEKLGALVELVSAATLEVHDEDDLLGTLVSLRDLVDVAPGNEFLRGIPVKQPSCIGELKAQLSSLGVKTPLPSPPMVMGLVDTALAGLKGRVSRHEQDVKRLRDRIEKLGKAERVEVEQPCSDDELIEKTTTYAELQGQLDKALAYQKWVTGLEARSAEIHAIEDQVKEGGAAIAGYQLRRSAYLDGATSGVADLANKIVSHLGFDPISVEIGTSGKRGTLTVTAGGIDIAAMSGCERIVYGSALLHAFQELSGAKCPLLFIEAAEMDDVALSQLLTAFSANRTAGNVLIGHWSTVNLDLQGIVRNFKCHTFERGV